MGATRKDSIKIRKQCITCEYRRKLECELNDKNKTLCLRQNTKSCKDYNEKK